MKQPASYCPARTLVSSFTKVSVSLALAILTSSKKHTKKKRKSIQNILCKNDLGKRSIFFNDDRKNKRWVVKGKEEKNRKNLKYLHEKLKKEEEIWIEKKETKSWKGNTSTHE